MAGKPKPIIIEAEDFRVFLAARMGALRLSAPAMAEQLELTPTAVYALLSGDLAPSDKVVRKLGLRPAYIMDVRGEAEEQPTKPAPLRRKK